MALQRIQPGQKFRPSATAWNAAMEATEAFLQTSRTAGIASGPDARWQYITIRNDSGADRDQFDVLGINGVAITPTENEDEFKSRPILSGVTPADAHAGKFAILQEPIPVGEYGRAMISGQSIARIKLIDGTAIGLFAERISGDATKLEHGNTGSVRILYLEDPTEDAEYSLGVIRFDGGTGIIGDPINNTASGLDCPVWDCIYSEGSLVSVSCGSITAAPLKYEFGFEQGCTCCDGRARGAPVIMTHVSGCVWESEPFACADDGASCGTTKWKWSVSAAGEPDPANCGQVLYQARIKNYDPNVSCGYWDFVWNAGSNTWDAAAPSWGNCADPPCSPTSAPPWPGLYDGQPVRRYCYEYEWVLATNNCICGGGTPPPPERTPTDGDEEWIDCTSALEGGCICGSGSARWVLLSASCTCGSTEPPKFDGTKDGQIVTIPCAAIDYGYTSSAKWRLTLNTDGTAVLQLVTSSDAVIIEYHTVPDRNWCPLCTNTMRWVGPCGPYACVNWSMQICVRPYVPTPTCGDCPELPDEFVVPISTFNSLTYDTYTGWDQLNGTWSLSLYDVYTETSSIGDQSTYNLYRSAPWTYHHVYYDLEDDYTVYWSMTVICRDGNIWAEMELVGAPALHPNYGVSFSGRYNVHACVDDESPQPLPMRVCITKQSAPGNESLLTECYEDCIDHASNIFFTSDCGNNITASPVV